MALKVNQDDYFYASSAAAGFRVSFPEACKCTYM